MKLKILIFIYISAVFQLSAQNKIWQFATEKFDQPGNIASDTAANKYVIMRLDQKGCLYKLDADGNELWHKADLNWNPTAIKVKGNAFYITGSFKTGWNPSGSTIFTAVGEADFFLAKYDLQGNNIWVKTAGSTSEDWAECIVMDELENIYVSGKYYGNMSFQKGILTHSGEGDLFFVKYSKNGDEKWIKRIGSSLIDNLYNLCWFPQKNELLLNAYIQVGTNLGNGLFTSDNTTITVIYDTSGKPLQIINNVNNMQLLGIEPAGTSVYWHTGLDYYDSSGVISKYNGNYTLQWTRKVRKGQKKILFMKDQIVLYGTSPKIVNMVVRSMSYMSRYNVGGNMLSDDSLSLKATFHYVEPLANQLWITGSFTDTLNLPGSPALYSKGDRDLFVFVMDNNSAGVNISNKFIEGIILYPNPVTEMIHLDKRAYNYQCEIISMDGRNLNIPVIPVDVTYTMDVSELNPGIYFLRLTSDQGIQTIKFIKL